MKKLTTEDKSKAKSFFQERSLLTKVALTSFVAILVSAGTIGLVRSLADILKPILDATIKVGGVALWLTFAVSAVARIVIEVIRRGKPLVAKAKEARAEAAERKAQEETEAKAVEAEERSAEGVVIHG